MIILSESKTAERSSGFSLVEVVVAVGIFAVAIVGVIGLLAPTTQSISNVSDSDSASRVITAIQSGLQQGGYNTVKNALNAGSATKFYATKSGDKVGDAAVFSAASLKDQDKFFEFTLQRNTTLSPVGNDDTAGFLAFTIVLKWPAFAPTANGDGAAVVDSQKSVMVVPAAITR